MSHLAAELQHLKDEVFQLLQLVHSQIEKSKEAISTSDRDLASHVVANDKRVNASELTIDRDCENILALYNPVAIDLRFVLACIKMNHSLERIGDNAEGLAMYVNYAPGPFPQDLLDAFNIMPAFDRALEMFSLIMDAYRQEDPSLARKVFNLDELLNQHNREATKIAIAKMKSNPEIAEEILYIMGAMRKIERMGDLTKNMAEEIIFYIEAKVLRHIKKQ
jgi:phosphate transport system protein